MSDQLAPAEPALTGGGASTPPGGRGGLRAFLSDVNRRRTWYADALTTLIAIILAFLVGAVLMIISDPAVISQYAYLFTAPELPLGRRGRRSPAPTRHWWPVRSADCGHWPRRLPRRHR